MILRKFGIQLHSLEHKDIQLTRTWRNADFVRKNMIFDREITSEMQEVWYNNLQKTDVYLVINHQSSQIGVIHVKNIDWHTRTGEAGIFIGEQEYLNSYIPMLAVICLMDVFFNEFSFNGLKAKVKKGNKEALDFNYSLGYSLVHEAEEHYLLGVTNESYATARTNLSKVLNSFNKEIVNHTFTPEEKNYFFLRK